MLLFIIILFFQADQYQLCNKKGDSVGMIAIYKETAWVKFNGQSAETFKIEAVFKQMNYTSYYITNEKATGYLLFSSTVVHIDLLVYKKHHYNEYFEYKK